MARSKPIRRRRQPYHHGDLHATLLDAAWEIVAEEGVASLTLRACARRAGVSHAAPEHHFGNVAGLLEEFATEGYERMAAAMDAVAAERMDQPLLAAGLGYVRFAQEFPEHFRIMARVATRPSSSERFRTASSGTRRRLEGALQAAYVRLHGKELSPAALSIRSALAWCSVHGYAMLKVDEFAEDSELPDAIAMLSLLGPSLLGP